jgi:hypothetical protein
LEIFMHIRRVIPWLLILAVLLAACRGSSDPIVEETPSPGVEETASSGVTPPPADTPAPALPPAAGQAGCTVVPVSSEPDPMIEELFPPVSDEDWVKGPGSARVTIIEYSDFQ